MTQRILVLTTAAVLAMVGCAHSRHVGQEGSEGGTPGGEETGKAAGHRGTAARVPPRAGRPAVAASPEGLMNPGSTHRIQEALRSKGYLAEVSDDLDTATAAGLRRFQHDQHLAETGAPDRETLKRLGVDPQDVYRSVPPGKEASPGR